MKKKQLFPGVLILVCCLALVGAALASNGEVIERSVFGSGGEPVTDGSQFILDGTLGEPIASELEIAADNGLSSGFWWPKQKEQLTISLPLVMRSAP